MQAETERTLPLCTRVGQRTNWRKHFLWRLSFNFVRFVHLIAYFCFITALEESYLLWK